MSHTKDYCLSHPSIAYASVLGGVEIKGIMYGFDDYVYAVSGTWCSQMSYHCVRLHYTASDRAFFQIHGCRIYLDECIPMN